MSNVFVIGATGKIGKRLSPMLVSAGHNVTGLSRSSANDNWYQQNQVASVNGDIIDISVEELSDLMAGHDVVVFSAGAAGSGLDRTQAIDGDGPVKVIEAMKRNNIRRLYLVSAFPEAGRKKDLGEGFEFYMEVKKQADAEVAATSLDWVIVRPGTLLDEEGDGAVSLGKAIPYGTVKRGNVAKVLAILIDLPLIRREIIELTDGDEAVDVALSNFAKA